MIKKVIKFLGVMVVVAFLAFLLRLYSEGQRSATMSPPSTIGLKCPDKPNCVSSMAKGDHFIEPLQTNKTRNEMSLVLKNLGIKASLADDNMKIHGEYESTLFGFVDDIDIVYSASNPGVLHIRSASRVGHSDMSANRKRVEAIRAALK